MDHLKDKPAEASGLATFLGSLDYALTTMGDGGTRVIAPDRTKPDNAPKTGGEVLKEGIDKAKDRGPDSPDSKSRKSGDTPKTSGDVLRDLAKSERLDTGSGR